MASIVLRLHVRLLLIQVNSPLGAPCSNPNFASQLSGSPFRLRILLDPQDLLHQELLTGLQGMVTINSTRFEADVTLLAAFLHVSDFGSAFGRVPRGDAEMLFKRDVVSVEQNIEVSPGIPLTLASQPSELSTCPSRR